MKNLCTLLLSLSMITSFSQEVKKRNISSSQIDEIFAQWNAQNIPGIAVGILNDGKIVHTKGYGMANLEHQIPITFSTKFNIGDLAKEFTVYALLLLEERGQLSLKDDIRKYLPKRVPFSNAISIQQLIHHTGGLNNDVVAKSLAGWNDEDIFTKEHAYQMIHNQSKSTTNNTEVQLFSEMGFMILEDLIAKISKTSYSNFITKEIFEPLGMTNSVFDIQGTIIKNKAQGYFSHQGKFINSPANYAHTLVTDLYTTVEDMCLWAKELESPKIGNENIIKKFDGLSIINKKRVREENMALYTGGHRFWNFRGTKKLYHTDVSGGYASKLIRYPDYNLAVVIMGNDGAYNGYAGTGASALFIEDFLESRSIEPTKFVSKKLSAKQLAKFEGNYWDINNYSTRKIHVVNDTLRYHRGPGNESALVPLSKDSFQMITSIEVIAKFDSKTDPKKVSIIVGDNTSHLVRYNPKANWTKSLNQYAGTYYAKALNTSYSLTVKEGKLLLNHQRISPVQLDPKIPNVFTGNRRHFSSLAFKKDKNGNITGFQLSANGINDIWFKKEKVKDKTLLSMN